MEEDHSGVAIAGGNDKKTSSPPINTADLYDVKQTLNNGAFGKVSLVALKSDKNKLRVIRDIDLTKLLPPNIRFDALEGVGDEAKNLNRHGHPNIVRIYNVTKAKNIVTCEMEYCEGGTLDQYLKNRKGDLLGEQQIVIWFSQMALAVNYFADQKLSHCDLTAKNIYLKKPSPDDTPVIKIGDYCNSHLKAFYYQDILALLLKTEEIIQKVKQRREEKRKRKAARRSVSLKSSDSEQDDENAIPNLEQTVEQSKPPPEPLKVTVKPDNVGYLAPEVLQGKSTGILDEKADVWSLGVLLFQMATLRLPVCETNVPVLLDKIKKEERDAYVNVSRYSNEMRHMIERLLKFDAKERPSLAEILKDRFIRDLVAQMTGGRGWTAIYREEQTAREKVRREAEIAEQKELAERLKKSQAAVLQSDYSSKFSGYLITSPWFTAPSGIADMAIVHSPQNLVIVICANGDIFAVKNNPDTNRAKMLWRGCVNVSPDFTAKISIEHAAVDPFDEPILDIYFTLVEDRSGIFHVGVKQLKDAFAMNPNKPATVWAKQFLHEKGRRFGGLAISSKAKLLFCCDQFSNYDIGVWSMETRKLVGRIKHPKAELQFQPLKCAFYCNENASKLHLAAIDNEHSMVYIFTLRQNEEDGSVKRESVQTVATFGNAGDASVDRPRGVFFDYSGEKLFVADERNARIQVFSNKGGESWQIVSTLPTRSPQTLLKIKVPSVGVLLDEDVTTIKDPADFRPFILQAYSWQCQILAHFLPPGT